MLGSPLNHQYNKGKFFVAYLEIKDLGLGRPPSLTLPPIVEGCIQNPAPHANVSEAQY